MTKQMKNRDSFEVSNYIISELGSGVWGNVYASIPKRIADQIIADFRRYPSPLTATTAKLQLRAAIEAAKVTKGRKTTSRSADGKSVTTWDNCKHEIEVLQALNTGNYPNMSRLRSVDTSYNWLALEPLVGKSMYEFHLHMNNYSQSPKSAGLVWHWLFQFAEAFLALHFGLKDGEFFDTGRYAHTDLTMYNIMLRPLGAYRDYPDVVIIDFGSVEKVGGDYTGDEKVPGCNCGTKDQAQDLQRGIRAVMQYAMNFDNGPTSDIPGLMDFYQRNERWRVDEDEAKANESYFIYLIELRDEASDRREVLYEPLPSEIVAYFEEHGQIVSDEDLEKVFPALADELGGTLTRMFSFLSSHL